MVTEIATESDSVERAVFLIEEALGSFRHREIISANEVTDLLLDLRGLVAPLAVSAPAPEVAALS